MKTPTTNRKIAKNLLRSVSGISFPLAGSVVVIYTLSGHTRSVAIVATIIATIGHVIHSMIELGENHAVREQTDAVTATSTMN